MKKSAIIGGVIGLIVIILEIAAYMGEKSSIGVIGGADGPTAVFVTGINGSLIATLALIVAVLIISALIIYIKKKRK